MNEGGFFMRMGTHPGGRGRWPPRQAGVAKAGNETRGIGRS